MSVWLRVVVGAIAAVVSLAGAVGGASAALADTETDASTAVLASTDVDAFTFESMDVVYTIGRTEDGASTLEVVETFVALFPEFDQNRGMRRAIPDSYQGAPLHPHLVSITDESGEARPSEVASEDGAYFMTSRASEYLHGRQTFVFTYTLENVTRYFADTGADEFYWDVNGVDWRQPFGRVSATLMVPPELADALTGQQSCYQGYQGSTQQCAITAAPSADGGATVVASASDLAAFQTMSMAVGFAQGTFTSFDTTYLASPWGWAQGIAALFAGGAVVFAGITRSRRLRDEPGRPTIIAEYTPPRQVDALESAVLLGRTTKAIPAEVLEQAVVGSIRIIEGERSWTGRTKLRAVLVDPSLADGDGRMLLDGLFPMGTPGEEFEFGRSDTRLSSAAQAIVKAANRELDRRGLRRRVPWTVRALPVLAVIVAAGLVALFGFAALDSFVDAWVPILVIIATAFAVIATIGLVSHKPLTAEGAEVRDHLKGLEVFIEWAEADRIRMLQSPQGAERVQIDPNDPREMLKLYERLLPYAVVFGQERQWAEHLAVLYRSEGDPGWYSGSGTFNAAAFSAGIGTLSSSATASSSTSGGSGGGGSAGGGGGGGGGGGV